MKHKWGEPMPSANDLPGMWEEVQKDMKERDLFGRKKYKTKLQPFNGRDALNDLYEELLDAIVYTKQLTFEIEKVRNLLEDAIYAIENKSKNRSHVKEILKEAIDKLPGKS